MGLVRVHVVRQSTGNKKADRAFRKMVRAYRRWMSHDDSVARSMDCGLHLRRHISGGYAGLEADVQKHANALRAFGETVPPVPGEPGFK